MDTYRAVGYGAAVLVALALPQPLASQTPVVAIVRAAGKRADLVLLDASPLADIANVRRIHAVVVAGRLLDRKELDEVLARVKAAASAP